jgi:hypothetical protein
MKHTVSSILLKRLGLQGAFLAAACSFLSTNVLACVEGPTASANQRVAFARIKGHFDRLKAAQKVREAMTNSITPKDDSSAPPPSMVGMWMTTLTADGDVFDVGFDVWHSDGTQVLNDSPAPAAGAVCLGIWTKTGDYTYELKHPTWLFDDTNTNLIGIGYLLEKITLDPSGKSFTGTFAAEGYDLDGNHVFQVDGDANGDRVNMDPPPNAGPIAMTKSWYVGPSRR